MRGQTKETRLASKWGARLDRALANLRRNNILVRIDRRKRQSTTIINIICYDLTTAARTQAVTTPVDRKTKRARFNPCSGKWEIPYVYTSDTGIGPFGVQWVIRIVLSSAVTTPQIQFMTSHGSGTSGGFIEFLDGADYRVLTDLCTDMLGRVTDSPAITEPNKYCSTMKLYTVPAPNELIAVFVDPSITQKQLCAKIHNHFGITMKEACAPLIAEEILQLPNN